MRKNNFSTPIEGTTSHGRQNHKIHSRCSCSVTLFTSTGFISTGDALDMRARKVWGANIQGREVDMSGTQQELYESFRDKYAYQLE